MNDEEIALQLHQDLLGDKAAFPCGCVVRKLVIYPGKDWVRTGEALHQCPQHPSYFESTVEGIRSQMNALEQRWVTPNGTEIFERDLERAMEDWLWKAGDMRVEWHPGGLRAAAKTKDPWIVTGDGKHLVNRRGQTLTLPRGLVAAHKPKPGVLIDPATLNLTQSPDFFSMGIHDSQLITRTFPTRFPPLKSPIVDAAVQMHRDFPISKNIALEMTEKFKVTFPALTKNIEIRASHPMKMKWSDQPLEYAAKDAELTLELIQKREGNPDPQYGTPPSGISFTTSQEGWKEGMRKAGVVVETAVMGEAVDRAFEDLDRVLDAPEDNDE